MGPWLALLGAALGADRLPVVYAQGTGPEAVAAVRAGTGLPAEQLEAIPLQRLLDQRPKVLGEATLRHCTGTPTKSPDLRALTLRAETASRAGDPAAAMDQLDLGIAGLGCLGDRLEPATAARMFQLRGGLMAADGHLDDARAELRTALSLHPGAAWDNGLPMAGSAVLEEVRDETHTARLEVVPMLASAGPMLDGARAPDGGRLFDTRPALHLLQVPDTSGLHTAWLALRGDAVLVVPGHFRAPVLARLQDERDRTEVGMLLRATLDTQAAYVVDQGWLWLVSFEGLGGEITTLIAPPPPVEDAQGGKRSGKKGKKKAR